MRKYLVLTAAMLCCLAVGSADSARAACGTPYGAYQSLVGRSVAYYFTNLTKYKITLVSGDMNANTSGDRVVMPGYPAQIPSPFGYKYFHMTVPVMVAYRSVKDGVWNPLFEIDYQFKTDLKVQFKLVNNVLGHYVTDTRVDYLKLATGVMDLIKGLVEAAGGHAMDGLGALVKGAKTAYDAANQSKEFYVPKGIYSYGEFTVGGNNFNCQDSGNDVAVVVNGLFVLQTTAVRAAYKNSALDPKHWTEMVPPHYYIVNIFTMDQYNKAKAKYLAEQYDPAGQDNREFLDAAAGLLATACSDIPGGGFPLTWDDWEIIHQTIELAGADMAGAGDLAAAWELLNRASGCDQAQGGNND